MKQPKKLTRCEKIAVGKLNERPADPRLAAYWDKIKAFGEAYGLQDRSGHPETAGRQESINAG